MYSIFRRSAEPRLINRLPHKLLLVIIDKKSPTSTRLMEWARVLAGVFCFPTDKSLPQRSHYRSHYPPCDCPCYCPSAPYQRHNSVVDIRTPVPALKNAIDDSAPATLPVPFFWLLINQRRQPLCLSRQRTFKTWLMMEG